MGKNDYHYNPWYPVEHFSQMISFDKKFHYRCISSFAIVSCCLHFQDYRTSIAQLVDPFYCLQCKFIVRNFKSTLKQLIHLHASLLTDSMLCQRDPKNYCLNIGYILHAYILKLVLGDIFLLHSFIRLNIY